MSRANRSLQGSFLWHVNAYGSAPPRSAHGTGGIPDLTASRRRRRWGYPAGMRRASGTVTAWQPHAHENRGMPTLSAPRLLTFLASAVLIGLAVASLYTKVPMVGRTVLAHRQWFFIGAYALLALGVTTKSL